MYYDDELRGQVIHETVRYSKQKNHPSFILDEHDLDIFVAILLFS